MSSFFSHLGRNCCLDNVIQFKSGLNGLLLTGFDDMLCNVLCELIFPVVPDDPVKLHLGIFIDNGLCRQRLASVHAHVQLSIIFIGKTSLHCIQLIRRNSQVKENTVHLVHTQFIQYSRHIHIIVSHNGGTTALCIFLQMCTCSCNGCIVLVNADMTSGGKSFTDLAGMSAAAQGSVHIDAIGSDVKSFYCLFQ